MKKYLLVVLMVLSIVIMPNIKAACTYQEQANLNKEVANIKVVYETITKEKEAKQADGSETTIVKYDIFGINILNLSDNFYIEYSNNVNSDKKTFYASDASDGIISFEWTNLEKVTTMVFKVYSSSKTNCKNELYRTIYVTLPRYNAYSSWNYCDGVKNVSVCEKYVTFDEISYGEFLDRLSNTTSNSVIYDNTSTNNTTENPTNNNISKYIYIGAGAIIVLIIITGIVISTKKRNKL